MSRDVKLEPQTVPTGSGACLELSFQTRSLGQEIICASRFLANWKLPDNLGGELASGVMAEAVTMVVAMVVPW